MLRIRRIVASSVSQCILHLSFLQRTTDGLDGNSLIRAHGCHGGAGVICHFVVALERPLLRGTHCIGSGRGLPVPHNRRVLASESELDLRGSKISG